MHITIEVHRPADDVAARVDRGRGAHRAPVGRERPEVVHAVGVETERVLNADLQGRRTGDVAVVVHRGCQGETIVEGREDLDRHRGHRAERAEAVGGVRIAHHGAPTADPESDREAALRNWIDELRRAAGVAIGAHARVGRRVAGHVAMDVDGHAGRHRGKAGEIVEAAAVRVAHGLLRCGARHHAVIVDGGDRRHGAVARVAEILDGVSRHVGGDVDVAGARRQQQCHRDPG